MKLKELYESSPDISKILKSFKIKVNDQNDGLVEVTNISKIVNKDGTIKPKVGILEFKSRGGPIKAYWPFTPSKQDDNVLAYYSGNDIIFDDWSSFTTGAELALESVIIKTLKGIENCKASSLWFQEDDAIGQKMEFECGLLLLLKFKGDFEEYDGDNHSLKKALRIICKYRDNHSINIPECQQELIEEGLQEYAKL